MTQAAATSPVSAAVVPMLTALHPDARDLRALLAANVSLHRALQLYPLELPVLGRALSTFITKNPETWRVPLMAADLRNFLFQAAMSISGPHHERFRGVRTQLAEIIPLSSLTETSEALVFSGQVLWLALNWAELPELADLTEQLLRMLARLAEAFPPRTEMAESLAVEAVGA